jgi:hypothetical protein
MKLFRNINNMGGWFVFLLSAIVYLLTLEPTVSFWTVVNSSPHRINYR